MIKVVAWNIQAGGGSRVLSIVKAIIKSRSSIVLLNEFRNNDAGAQLRSYFLKAGYRHQAVTSSKKNDNSVLIVSTLPFESELHEGADPLYSGNIVSARFSAFCVMSVYLPHKKEHRLLEYISEYVSESELPYIIGGDYNTGKNYIDQKGNSFWYTEQLLQLENNGYVDAFRLVNDDAEEYSWFSHQGNGFRYDHFYCDENMSSVITNCYYEHGWREDKLSDHSPMFLELG